MASRLTEIVIDCRDPRALAAFWAQVLGYAPVSENDDEVEIAEGERTVEAVRARPRRRRRSSCVFPRASASRTGCTST